MLKLEKIGLGGGCHWCTEAVFLSLNGVKKVEQGWIASKGEMDRFSEAIIVHFDKSVISLVVLIEVHLYTHKSTSAHSMRDKYRSAVYYFKDEQKNDATEILLKFQEEFELNIITQTLSFKSFKPSRNEILNYYFKNPEKPFCKTYIEPKLKVILNRFSKYSNLDKLNAI